MLDNFKKRAESLANKAKETAKSSVELGSEFIKDSAKSTSTAINIGIEQVTKPMNDAMDARRDGADNLLDTVTTKSGEISQNINLKGFVFEEEQARTFNEVAAKDGSSLRAIVDPPTGIDGKSAPDIRIVDTATGETIKNYQAKIGTEQYINKQIQEEKYQDGNTDAFVTDIDNGYNQAMKNLESIEKELSQTDFNDLDSLDELSKALDTMNEALDIESHVSHDGISAEAFTVEEMKEIAQNPTEYVEELHYSANSEEIMDGAMSGAAIGAIFQSLQESIKILAKLQKGQKVPKEVLTDALKNIMTTLSSSALRGALIKVIEIILEKQMEDSGALPLVIVSVAPIVYKTLLSYFKGEMTLEECVNIVGTEALSKGMMITISIVFPPVGFAMMGVSILVSIWKEFDLENEILNKYPQVEKVFIFVNKVDNRRTYLIDSGKLRLQELKINTAQSVKDKKELIQNSYNERFVKLAKS
ncbi:hypothetical protein CVO_02485 [Sulfurimonas sp. CVO]|uniref:hypothetical protein n=1 Tax=Sulfurimonas sp. CVO TaxID=2283483 RepID=UPI00132EAAE1|nr:hypothetical protein [Sulfurimonas sp. CVO]QHG90773.1 hypothetical protein CVO_02485 [Sulfurimonas sp. CVO]